MTSTAACVRLNSPRSSKVAKLKAMKYNIFSKILQNSCRYVTQNRCSADTKEQEGRNWVQLLLMIDDWFKMEKNWRYSESHYQRTHTHTHSLTSVTWSQLLQQTTQYNIVLTLTQFVYQHSFSNLNIPF